MPRELVILLASLALGVAGGGGSDYFAQPDAGDLAVRIAVVETQCAALPVLEHRVDAVETTSTTTHSLVNEVYEIVDWAHPHPPRER